MAVVLFRKDVDQENQITALNTNKVSVTTFNSAISQLTTNLNNLAAKEAQDIEDTKALANSLVQGLKDNEIKALQDGLNLLNSDETTEGSVDYKIKAAINSIVNGAPEAYDTLKELLDYINKEGTDLNGLIQQLNDKVAAIVGAASDEYNTLEKIETKVKDTYTQIATARTDLTNAIDAVNGSIPVYENLNGLAIVFDAQNGVNTITLDHELTAIFDGMVKVYSEETDENGNVVGIVIENIFTAHIDPNDAKVIVVESDVDLSGFKALVNAFATRSALAQ